MMLRRLERPLWHEFLDSASHSLQGRRAEIEVSSPAVGSQILAHELRLLGILYDPRRDTVEIALDGFDHQVHRPRELYVDGPSFGWATLSVIDADGSLQILTVREPLMLPPAKEGATDSEIAAPERDRRRRR